MLYHNHDHEFQKIKGEYGLDVLYQSVPSELLQTQIDTCWVYVAGEDPAEYVRKYTGRAPLVHLQDFVMGENQESDSQRSVLSDEAVPSEEEFLAFRPLGYGVQNFPAILTAAEEAGAEWVIVGQDRPSMGKTPMESADMSRQYLKSLGI
jgi:sugar phosphate isomerase/epimerase